MAKYLESGPGFIFLFHPALGPLWDVVAQKVRGGALADGSELVLEVAEARLVDVTVDGSLLVAADAVMGHWEPPAGAGAGAAAGAGGAAAGPAGVALPVGAEAGAAEAEGAEAGAEAEPPRLVFSQRCGRVHLLNVEVSNVGVDWHHPGNVYWQHRVQRHEACRVILHGSAEFEAYDCRIVGDQTFEVPDGHRMVVTAAPRGGGLQRTLLPLAGAAPSWEWRYSMDADGDVRCEFVRNAALVELVSGASGGAGAGVGVGLGAGGAGDDEPMVLDFII